MTTFANRMKESRKKKRDERIELEKQIWAELLGDHDCYPCMCGDDSSEHHAVPTCLEGDFT